MYLGARTSAKERARDRRVLFNGAWLTPNEFQTVSGRGAAKDWKRTVKHAGQCIKALLAGRLLSIETEPVGCVCKHCTVDTVITLTYVLLEWNSYAYRFSFLARDVFARTNSRAIAMMFVRLSVCLGRACIVIAHVSADLNLGLDSLMFWTP